MSSKKKILILGTSGNLGYELYNKLKNDFLVIHNGLKKRKVDITNLENLKRIVIKHKPNIIINSVACVNLDLCEKDKKNCFKVNTKIIENLFLIKKQINQDFKLLHFSTDQFYDGKLLYRKENYKIRINNYYSKTKLLSEKIALKNGSTVFRTNFFGITKNKSGSLNRFLKKSLKTKSCVLFEDVYFNPLRIKTLAKIIKRIIKLNTLYPGLYNLASKNGLSKKSFYILIFKYLKRNVKVKSVKVNSYLNTKRSNNMLMSVNKFESKFKIQLPFIKNEIKKEVNENYEKIKNW